MNICWNQLKLNEVNDWDNVQKITDLYQWKLQPLIQVLCKWQPNSQHLQNYYKDQPCLTMLVQTCCKTIPVLKIDWKVWKLNHLFGTLLYFKRQNISKKCYLPNKQMTSWSTWSQESYVSLNIEEHLKYPYSMPYYWYLQNSLHWQRCQTEDWGASRCIFLHSL